MITTVISWKSVLLIRINDAMDVLLSRLDEAIDDMESDRVQIVKMYVSHNTLKLP